MKIVELLERDIKPRDIATLSAFRNAIAVDMALGCSTNTVLHVPAIAYEARVPVDLELFNEISRKAPHLCSLSPAGSHHIEDLNSAGGIMAVMKELSKKDGLIDQSCLTATGSALAESLRAAVVQDAEVIRSLDNPYHLEGALRFCAGI